MENNWLNFNTSVAAEMAGKRLDKFLVIWSSEQEDFDFDLSRGDWINIIKGKKVSVNGLVEKPSYKVEEGDKVDISIKKENKKKLLPQRSIEIETIFENKDFIIINKQSNISVHPDNKSHKDALVNGLVARYPEIVDVQDTDEWAYLRPGIVHRLDKDTTGVMIVARNQKSFDALKDKFKNREVTKKYQAIVYGKMESQECFVDKALARSTNYKKQVVAGQKTKTKVREALTEFSVLKQFEKYALVEARPKTGRMHQIRVHLFSLGNPIVGDRLYKKSEFMNDKYITADRQMLHAHSIEFELFGEKYSFTVELPKDFQRTLSKLNTRS